MDGENYVNCVNNKYKQIRYPVNPNSLYANGIYDRQEARRSCYYQMSPQGHMDRVEGFDGDVRPPNLNFMMLMVVLYVLMTACGNATPLLKKY